MLCHALSFAEGERSVMSDGVGKDLAKMYVILIHDTIDFLINTA